MIHIWRYLYVIFEEQRNYIKMGVGDKIISLQKSHSPEERSFLQQSEKPLKAAKWRGNIPCMPRLK